MTHPQTVPRLHFEVTLSASASVPPIGSPQIWRRAYRQLKPEAEALNDTALLRRMLDVPTSIEATLRCLVRLEQFRPEIVKLPAFDRSLFDRLKTTVHALLHAQIVWQGTTSEDAKVQTATKRCRALGDRLRKHAIAVTELGIPCVHRLHRQVASSDGVELAFNVMTISAQLGARWDEAGFDGARERRDLDRAEAVAEALMVAMAERESALNGRWSSAEQRRRYLTLLVITYEKIRRAVNFIRWNHRDADEVMPSLFASSQGRQRKEQIGRR